MGQGSSQLLTHTWIMKMAQKPWYITEKRKEKKGEIEKQKEKRRLKKYNNIKKGRTLNHLSYY